MIYKDGDYNKIKMDEKLESELRCGICQDIYKVPVFIDVEHSCFKMKYFCVRCAYLCFELHKEDRKKRYKCPFCNSGDYEINKDNIEVDDAMMLTINNLIIREKIGKLECNCGREFGDGYEMLAHLEEECEDFFYECEFCNSIMLRKDEHNCPMNECPECMCCLKDMNRMNKIKHFRDCKNKSDKEVMRLRDEIQKKTCEFEMLRVALITLGEDIQNRKSLRDNMLNKQTKMVDLIGILESKK